MANITINQTPSRAQYEASNGQTVYTYSFPIKADTDLKVYSRVAGSTPDDENDLLTITTDYTVQGANTANGGTVTLMVASTTGDIVTIVGDKPIDRSAIYDQSSTLKKADLNNDFNDNIMYDKQTSTLLEQLSPAYHRSEKIYRDLDNRANDVRADNLCLPILNDGYIWVGRGDDGDDPDDIVTVAIGDFDNLGILSAEYILGAPNAALPNAQDLNALGEGILYTTPDGDGTATVSLLNIGAGLNLDTATDTLSVIADGGVTVTQAGHGFDVGDWLYRDTGQYDLADASAAATAEAVGVVVEVVDANSFILQQSGMVTGGTVGLAGLTDATLYYLSDTTPGAMTATEPTDPASYSRPVYVATAADEGWVLPQRKILNSDLGGGGGGNPINQPTHGLSKGDWVRINGSGNFVAAQANTAENAESVGVVSSVIDADNFILQMLDYVDLTGVTYATVGPDAFTAGTIYFLDETNAGDITATEPSGGNVSKPMFVALDASTGYILHYRGVVSDSSSGGGGSGGNSWVVLGSETVSISTSSVDFDNIIDGTYVSIKFVWLNAIISSGVMGVRFGTGATPTYSSANYRGTLNGTTSMAPITGTVSSSADQSTGEGLLSDPNQAAIKTGVVHNGRYTSTGIQPGAEDGGIQWNDTTAITSIQFVGTTGNITAGTFIIMGLVG